MSKLKVSQIRTKIREMVGVNSTSNWVPVIPINGNSEPELRGYRGGWFTHGGKKIDHPRAYSKVGFSNMIYLHDTRRIIVGSDWIVENYGRKIYETESSKNSTAYRCYLAENKRNVEKGSGQTSLDDNDSNRASSF